MYSWVCSQGNECLINEEPVRWEHKQLCSTGEIDANSFCICATTFQSAKGRCADFCHSIETEINTGFLLLAALEASADEYCHPFATQAKGDACLDQSYGPLCDSAC